MKDYPTLMMIRTYSLFILISIFTSYSVFAEESPNKPANTIDQKEIAQTMKNLNDLMAAPSKRGLDTKDSNDSEDLSFDMPTGAAVAPSQTSAQASEKLGIQRSADILSNLEDESDSDSN